VFAGNDRYARGLAVAIHSSLTHLSGRVAPEIYILDDGLSDVTAPGYAASSTGPERRVPSTG
jgi:lipopolysaccharide biosynthesis glycosyltransferase